MTYEARLLEYDEMNCVDAALIYASISRITARRDKCAQQNSYGITQLTNRLKSPDKNTVVRGS